MSEMIERVAKAMAARCKRSHDWPFWLDEAKAAIEAMREPLAEELANAMRHAQVSKRHHGRRYDDPFLWADLLKDAIDAALRIR